jgi:hypothetical protein
MSTNEQVSDAWVARQIARTANACLRSIREEMRALQEDGCEVNDSLHDEWSRAFQGYSDAIATWNGLVP